MNKQHLHYLYCGWRFSEQRIPGLGVWVNNNGRLVRVSDKLWTEISEKKNLNSFSSGQHVNVFNAAHYRRSELAAEKILQTVLSGTGVLVQRTNKPYTNSILIEFLFKFNRIDAINSCLFDNGTLREVCRGIKYNTSDHIKYLHYN
jgi:hypothetical protein